MRHNPHHAIAEEAVVRRLIADNPWATLVSEADGEIVASHYPVLLDEAAERLTVVTHVGRPDEKIHRLGEREVLLIVAGPHGYISPSWYAEGATPAPTWNFSVAHCYGTPQLLDEEENLSVLARLVEHFERHVASPLLLDRERDRQLAKGTVGLRLPVDRFTCKVKMSQDKDEVSQRQVLEELRGGGPYGHEALADDMERALRPG